MPCAFKIPNILIRRMVLSPLAKPFISIRKKLREV
jgi:hypothetical protein